MRTAAILICLLAVLPAGAANQAVAPYQDAGEARPVLDGEDRVWAEGEADEQALLKSGHVRADPALAAYLQAIMERVFPEFAGQLQVQVANDSSLNAFALPQGTVFINMGLLARLENEAQLATILAHEGSHFIHRHGYQNIRHAKSLSGFAITAGILTGGVGGILGSAVASTSMSGYSRDAEREADRQGFGRLARAGYDVRESAAVFRLLAGEVKALDIREPFFFASHPRLQERIDSFEALIAGHDGPPGEAGAARFAAATVGLREEWLQAQIELGKPRSVIHVLSNPAMLARYPVHAHYYLGEAYRLRGEEGDSERAEAAWREAVARAPDFARSHRALGILALKRRDWAAARDALGRYLALAPAAHDAAFMRDYLALVEENLKP